jgi:hypothetical protein
MAIIKLQNSILDTYQSKFSRFLEDTSKSNWNNLISGRYVEIYNKKNQNITYHTIKCTRRINDFVLGTTHL